MGLWRECSRSFVPARLSHAERWARSCRAGGNEEREIAGANRTRKALNDFLLRAKRRSGAFCRRFLLGRDQLIGPG